MSGQVHKLFKDGKVMTLSACERLDNALKDNTDPALIDTMISSVYVNTNDNLTKILLKDIARLRKITLFEPEMFEPEGSVA